ncbi:aspartate/glutamate racemase family protein [Steroidobacter sp.]|uniref:aspartate/glutamate racemase family protein n=1 Tax=Steroidobacter sp. TaxID=1978227 RepID=UPI001A4BE294|nr:amino acid racemase [Steroidobacter sp.]MBL8266798.1 aspartate/glutamate racemase family protein [Steroidobacter sp.]
MNDSTRRLIGVLGGMGPMATIDFMAKVVALTPATCDQAHMPLIVHQVPQIPDRTAAIMGGGDAPLAPMLAGLRRLARAGVELAVIPCNTAHHWHAQLSQLQELPLLHIAEAVRQELILSGAHDKKVALMATRGTHLAGVYSGRLGAAFEPLMTGDEAVQNLVDASIAAVKGGDLAQGTRAALEAADRLFAAGAEVLILGCTELPVALANTAIQDRCIDSTLALARLCVKESMRDDTNVRAA